MKIIFFGSGIYTVPIIEVLNPYGLALVVTTEDETNPEEKHKSYADYLKENNLPFLTSDLTSVSDIEKIKEIKPDIAILASYGVILKPEVINLFPKGIINIHPSLLPKYKGATPIQTAILNGDSETGITIHYLDEELDHGDIIKQEVYKLNGDETTQELKSKLFALGAQMIEEIIIKLEKGEPLESHAQDHAKEVFTKRRFSREDGKLDFNKLPDSKTLDRMIRAFCPWPGVWFETVFLGKKQRIKLLPNHTIQVEGKNAMSYKDFVNGYRESGRELLDKLGLLP